jgi:hypothetical protein
MSTIVRAACVALACSLISIGIVEAQPANMGCSSETSANGSQTQRCEGGVTIVAENGARYTLQDRDGNGRVDSVELSSKALLLEVPKKSGGNRFQVTTPQAIAAVRGTKWAVDAAEARRRFLSSTGASPLGGAPALTASPLGAAKASMLRQRVR